MKQWKIGKSMRFFFAVSGSMIWAGILLSGFDAVHWVSYLPATFFAFAAISGICPGIVISKALMREGN